MQNKNLFEIIFHVGRVTSLQIWVAKNDVTVKPLHLCPGMCSTSLLTILWKNFLGQSDCTTWGYQHIFQYDGTFRWKLYFGNFGMGHVFCTIIWNMGAILWSLRMTWGLSEAPGIERKPAFRD